MPFPSPASNGQTYEAGGYLYTFNSTKKTWVKTARSANAVVEVGNVQITANTSTITVGNTSITANAITVGNTSITANVISIGNTAITANAVTVGNTSITANAITVGNTRITSNAITVGNTSITANAITVGNTRITSNAITVGNTSITSNAITTGNISITSNSVSTGNVSISNTGFRAGNVVIDSNGFARFTSVSAMEFTGLANNISLIQLSDVDWQDSNVSMPYYLTDGKFLKYDSASSNWVPADPYVTNATFAETSNLAIYSTISDSANVANVAIRVLTLSNLTTGNLTEGNNLYYTNARVYTAIAANLVLKANVVDLTTANVRELGNTTTGNVYFSNARARAALTGALNIDYNPITGNISLVNNPSFGGFTAANGIITGNLTVLGNLIAQASAANTLDNPILYLANNSVTDAVDIGFVGSYKPAGDVTRMTGLFRDATDTKYKLFQNGLYNVSTTVNTGDGAFSFANLQIDTLFGKLEWANIQSKPDPVITVTLTGNVTGTASATLQDLTSNTITIATTLASIPTSTITEVLGNLNNGSGLTTSNIAEGSNLYYTNARVVSNVSLLSINVLADVDTTGVLTGNTLVWDGTKFVPGTSPIGAGQTVNNANLSNFANISNFSNVSLASNVANTANFANLAGSANVASNANFANIAGTVLSLSNFTTSNVAEGSNLYFTNARVITAINNSVLGNVYIANLTAGNISYVGNLTVGNIVSAHGFIQLDNDERNTIIQAGVWSYRFDDDGNFYVPNIIVTGSIFGNISGNINVGTLSQEQVQDFAAPLLTNGVHSGVTFTYDDTNNRINAVVTGGGGGSNDFSNIAGLANFANTANIANIVLSLNNFTTSNLVEGTNLYFSNARAITAVTTANITNLTVTNNIVVSNVIATRFFIGNGALITGINTTLVSEGTNLYYTNARVLSYVSNISLPNLTVSGNIVAANIIATKFIGDGSGLTGISSSGISGINQSNLAQLPTYNGNALLGNVVVTGNVTTGNILTVLGNASIGNLVVTGKLFGDGSGLTGISGSSISGFNQSNLTQLPTYNGNILAGNLVISGNATTGNILVVNGNVLVGNIFASRITGTHLGDGSALTGITTNIVSEGSNLYYTQARFDSAFAAKSTTNLPEGSNLYYTNARVIAGVASANIANLTVTANIVGGSLVGSTVRTSNIIYTDNSYITASLNNNTTIRANTSDFVFSDRGILVAPSITVSSNLRIRNILETDSVARFAGNIIPLVDSYYSLGTPTNRFKSLYVSGNTIDISDALLKFEDNKFKFQSSTGNPATVEIFANSVIETGTTTTGNVFFTNVRARSAIANSTGVLYDVNTGLISIGQSVATTSDVTFKDGTFTGNLIVQGDTVTLNTSVVLIEDKNILLANGALNAAAADGAGISVAGAGANIQYTSSINRWAFNKDIDITGNVFASGNVSATKFIGDGSALTGISAGAATSNLTQLPTYNGNALLGNLVISGNATIGNVLVVNGNASIGNLVVTGKLFGDGSALTGISAGAATSNLTQLPTYNGNALLGNVVVTGNATIGNVLVVNGNTSILGSLIVSNNFSASNITINSGTLTSANDNNTEIRAGIWQYKFKDDGYAIFPNLSIGAGSLGTAADNNTQIRAGIWQYTFNDQGNLLVPNIVVSGKLFGDGSALTGISAGAATSNLTQLPTYNGNILAGNLVISGNATIGNVLVVNGNASIGNIFASRITGTHLGDGSGLTGISGSSISGFNQSNLTQLPTYNGNALLGNLVISGNATIGNVLVVNGNASIGNIFASRITGTYLGDGSALTGITTNIVSEGSNLYYTNARVLSYVSNVSVPNLTVSGNVTANNLLVAGALYSSSTDNNTQIRAGIWQYTFNDQGNLLVPNIVASGNVTANNLLVAGALYSSSTDNNTQIRAGIWQYTFNDQGNLLVPNIVVSGKLFGDGSALTGISAGAATSNLTQLPTYNGNILAGNLVISGNATTGNILVVQGNASIGNLVVTGKLFGDGSGLTGISGSSISGFNQSNLTQLPTYNGNALLGNLVISGNATTGNILTVLGNAVVLGNLFVGNISGNNFNGITATFVDLRSSGRYYGNNIGNVATYTSNVSVGNLVVGNVISTPSGSNANLIIDPDGTGEVIFPVNTEVIIQSTIQANSNVSGALIVTGGIGIGGNIYSGANIVATGNIYGTYFVGNGALLTGLTASGITGINQSNLTQLPTYNGNILAGNLVISGNATTGNILTVLGNAAVLGNLFVANILVGGIIGRQGGLTNITLMTGGNVVIDTGPFETRFFDTGNVAFPSNISATFFVGNGALLTGLTTSLAGMSTYGGNILASNLTVGNIFISGNITAGNNSSFSISNDNNTIIRAGNFSTQFLDTGNLSVGGNIIATGRITGDGSGLTNVIISLGNQGQASVDATVRSRAMMYSILFR